jgi:hypothetical protein
MLAVRHLQFLLVALVAVSLMAACGGAPAAEPATTAPAPTAKPTLTPRPTAKPKPTAAPTAEPTEAPTAEPEPTAISTAGSKLLEVEIGDLKTYTHDNDLFTIDAPAGWTFKDNSKPTEAIVTWTDPHENAFMLVDIFEQDTDQTKQELATFLKNYLEKTFGSQTDFAQEEAKESGPSMLIIWTYTGEGTGGVKAKLLANSFIKRKGNKVSLFTLVVPEEQFDKLQPKLDNILGSYTINSSVALNPDTSGSNGSAEIQIGELETYTYKTSLFSIDVPKDWKLQDNSKPGEAILLWNEPSGKALIAVDIFEQTEKQSSEKLTKFLQDFLTKTFGSEQDFQLDEPKIQKDNSVLIVWSYTDKTLNNLKVLGNSFIEQRDNKESILSTLVPDDQFDTLLPSTNKIIQSYKIDSASDLP